MNKCNVIWGEDKYLTCTINHHAGNMCELDGVKSDHELEKIIDKSISIKTENSQESVGFAIVEARLKLKYQAKRDIKAYVDRKVSDKDDALDKSLNAPLTNLLPQLTDVQLIKLKRFIVGKVNQNEVIKESGDKIEFTRYTRRNTEKCD
jgi:uncharacterized membrane protein YdfJ with MMPL/SSD domain